MGEGTEVLQNHLRPAILVATSGDTGGEGWGRASAHVNWRIPGPAGVGRLV